ncbi:MAG TPA: hypothetical protein P5511_08685, partial [Candidatus Goldiibacteriota bacterium]|nr:hypothetical protein [Candidatus Goldiibacteriota bacterium]
KADRGQSDIRAMKLKLVNTLSASSMQVTALRLQAMNHAGPVNFSGNISRIVISDATTTYADTSAMPVSGTANITFTTPVTVPAAGVEKEVDVYISLNAAINTYDIGLRLPQAADIAVSGGYTVLGLSGFAFPFATQRAVLMQPVSSVNVSHVTLMPANVTKGQDNVRPFVLKFTHPNSVTTYSACVIKGITITALANDAAPASALFDGMRISDGISQFSGPAIFSASSGAVWLPFGQNLTVTANSYREVTVLADIRADAASASFYMSLSKTTDILAIVKAAVLP